MREYDRSGCHSGKRFNYWLCEQLERDHGGNRIPWQTEKVALLLLPSLRHSPEHNRPSRLDLRSREKKLCFQVREDLLYEIVFPHGDASRNQEEIALEPLLDQFPQARTLVRRNRQQHRLSATSLYLRGQRIAVGISDLTRPGRQIDVNYLIARRKHSHPRSCMHHQP